MVLKLTYGDDETAEINSHYMRTKNNKSRLKVRHGHLLYPLHLYFNKTEHFINKFYLYLLFHQRLPFLTCFSIVIIHALQ